VSHWAGILELSENIEDAIKLRRYPSLKGDVGLMVADSHLNMNDRLHYVPDL